MDDFEVEEQDDVYEYVEEEEYRKLVESRGQREDFVVDDDGLGHYDDGEERLGDEAAEEEGRTKKRAGSTANITAAALKRARKTKAMLLEKKKLGQDDSILLITLVIKDKRQCGISHNEGPVVSRSRQLRIEHPTTRPHLETTWETWIHSLMDWIVRFLPKSLLLQVVDAVVLLVLMVVHLLPLVEVHHDLHCILRLVAVPRVLLHRVRVRLMLATLLPETTMMNKMTNTLLDFMITVMIP